jgi:hypothetical protein
MATLPQRERVFKSKSFAREARKAGIGDDELCEAVGQVIKGRCEDLGGSVYKKRVSRNLYRSIILAKGGRYWILQFLFAKKDRANIDDDELRFFRELARGYEKLTSSKLAVLLEDKDLTEICHGDQA